MNANETPAGPSHEASQKPRIPLVAEILGYVGGALALGAIVALMTTYWAQLGVAGRIGIPAVAGIAGLLGGYAVSRIETPAAGRLAQFLLFVGVAGLSAACGIGAYEIGQQSAAGLGVAEKQQAMKKAGEWAWFTGFAAAAVLGGAVWWGRRTVLQHLAFGLGVGVGSVLMLPLIPVDGPTWGAGLTLMIVALVWGALSMKGSLAPEKTSLSLASAGLVGGAMMMAISENGEPLEWALWVTLGVAAVMVVAGIQLKRGILLGFGVAGMLIATQSLIQVLFENSIFGPIALFVVGLLFVAGAVALALRRPKGEARPGIAVPDLDAMGARAEPAAQVRPIPLPAELLGYGGGAFAVVAAMALLGEFWDQLGLPGRLGVAAVCAALGIVGGLAVGRQNSPGARRLEQFMLAVGTAAVGLIGAISAYQAGWMRFGHPSMDSPDWASTWATFAGFFVAFVVAAVIWRLRPTFVQQLALGVGAFGTATSAIGLLGPGGAPFWAEGLAMVVVGVVWGVGVLAGLLKPVSVALAVSCFALLVGVSQWTLGPFGDTEPRVNVWAFWLGLALAAGMIGASIPLKRIVLLGFGAVGIVFFSTDYVQTVYANRISGPILLLIVGVVFVAMAVLVGVLFPRMRGNRPGSPETPSGLGPPADATA